MALVFFGETADVSIIACERDGALSVLLTPSESPLGRGGESSWEPFRPGHPLREGGSRTAPTSCPLTLCEGDGAVSVLLTPCESPPLRGSVEFAGPTLPPRASHASGRFANRPYVLRTFPPHSGGDPGSRPPLWMDVPSAERRAIYACVSSTLGRLG